MDMFKNVLVVVEPGPQSDSAVRRARALALHSGARLTLFGVVRDIPGGARAVTGTLPPEGFQGQVVADLRAGIAAAADDLRAAGIEIDSTVAVGRPFIEVVRKVLRDGHDLVIQAAEGRVGLRERLFGSLSLHLMRKCPCPVWVVKADGPQRYARILAAVDIGEEFQFSGRSSLNPVILQYAAALARMDGSELHVVQAWSLYQEGYMQARGGMDDSALRKLRRETREHYEQQLRAFVAGQDLGGVRAHEHVVHGDAPRMITNLVRKERFDLLVMGTLCRTGLAGLLIGNTAEKVLNTVGCSVLTVKPEGFVSPVTLDDA